MLLIVGKTAVKYAALSATANAALLPSQLDAGSVGIYGRDKDGAKDVLIIQGASTTGKVQASLFKGKTIRICEGLGGGKFKVSEYIDLAGINLAQCNAAAYLAPVAWIGYIGYNDITTVGTLGVPTSTKVKNPFTIRIVEQQVNNASEQNYPRYYDVNINAGTAGATYEEAAADAIVATINTVVAGQDTLFTATKVSSTPKFGVKLVAADTTKQYYISVLGTPIENTDISYIPGVTGAGTYDKVLAMEVLSSPYRGDIQTMSTLDKHVVSSIVSGGTYDVYKITSVNTEIPGGGGGAGLAGNAVVQSSIGAIVAFAQPQTDAPGGNQTEFAEIMLDLVPNIFGDVVESA